jgi:hypothetical protein
VAKFSALLLLPMLGVIVVHLVVFQQRRDGAFLLALAGAAAAVTVVVIWLVYALRSGPPLPIVRIVDEWYATQALLPIYPDGPPEQELRRARATTPIGVAGKILLKARDLHLLPEPYLYGVALARRSAIVRGSYLRGEFSNTGFRSYFFWTFLYKTTLPAIAAIAVALWLARRTRQRALPYLIWPVVVYLSYSVLSNLNIGHRHILPIYPFLYVLCGSIALLWKTARARAIWFASIVTAALVVLVPRPAPLWGRHLSYMNELAGGPRRGYEKLLDSNFDWGQDLKRLGQWVRENRLSEPINLVYSGMGEPRYYGVPYRNMAFGYWSEPQLPLDQIAIPGFLAIDVSRLQGLAIVPEQRDTWRRVLEQRHAKPVGSAGYSILIYRLE